MKKKIFAALLILAVMMSISVSAFAETTTVDFGKVTFRSDGTMDPDQVKGVAEAASSLQPGDDITISITLVNEYKDDVDWYMKNPIGDTPEQNAAKGGAYSYVLKYSGADDDLFNSDKVGGVANSSGAPEGLKELDSSLKDYFHLGTMASGGTGTVTLKVAFEGETQGNVYQGKAADLQMQFAVETRGTRTVVRTGDTTNLNPYYIGMGVAGLLLLVLAVDGLVQRRKAGRKGV